MVSAQTEFPKQYDGAPSGDLYRDKHFRKLMKSFVPDCLFHCGRDMPLGDALDVVLKDSRVPVRVRDGRYVTVPGLGGPLPARARVFVDGSADWDWAGRVLVSSDEWGADAQPGGVFAAGEGRPDELWRVAAGVRAGYGEMDCGFASAVSADGLLITGENRRILLEHDADYCSPAYGRVGPGGSGCEQIKADAADLDVTAAYYLEQVHYATNGTAWMIGPDQQAWLGGEGKDVWRGCGPAGVSDSGDAGAGACDRPA